MGRSADCDHDAVKRCERQGPVLVKLGLLLDQALGQTRIDSWQDIGTHHWPVSSNETKTSEVEIFHNLFAI